MGNLPKAQSLKRLSHHHELWLGKQSLAGGSFSVLDTSLEVILGSGPTAVPLPKSTCPDHRAQWGGGRGAGVSTSLPRGSDTFYQPPSHHPVCPRGAHCSSTNILGWSPLLLILHATFQSSRGKEGMLSLNVSRKDFLFSFTLSFTGHHLQHPAGRTCTAKPAWLSLDTRSSVTKQLPRCDSHRGRPPRQAELLSLQRASETPGGWN